MIGGNAKNEVDHAHDDAVDEPAEVAGDRADERRRSSAASATSSSAIGTRHARAVDDAAEHVASELVRSEEVVRRTATATDAKLCASGS